jgi:hypothetical protein
METQEPEMGNAIDRYEDVPQRQPENQGIERSTKARNKMDSLRRMIAAMSNAKFSQCHGRQNL